MGQRSAESTMREVFAALGRYDLEELMGFWAEGSRYDNPMIGPAATDKPAVREQLATLIAKLSERGERLEIDRATQGPGRVVVEWHVEPGDGSRKGVHIAEVGSDGLVRTVAVYPRV